MLDNLGFKSQQAKKFFSSPNRPDWFWGHTQPPIQWVPRVLSQDPSKRNVKLITHLQQMSCNYKSTPTTCLHGMDKDNFTLLWTTAELAATATV